MSKWCNLANCWCDEAEEITEGQLGCDYECKGCEECEEIGETKEKKGRNK